MTGLRVGQAQVTTHTYDCSEEQCKNTLIMVSKRASISDRTLDLFLVYLGRSTKRRPTNSNPQKTSFCPGINRPHVQSVKAGENENSSKTEATDSGCWALDISLMKKCTLAHTQTRAENPVSTTFTDLPDAAFWTSLYIWFFCTHTHTHTQNRLNGLFAAMLCG